MDELPLPPWYTLVPVDTETKMKKIVLTLIYGVFTYISGTSTPSNNPQRNFRQDSAPPVVHRSRIMRPFARTRARPPRMTLPEDAAFAQRHLKSVLAEARA